MKRRKIGIAILTVILTLSCVFALCACNNSDNDGLELKKGSRPNHSSIISQDDANIINLALSDTATEQQKKAAVMALYNIANYSRQNTELSLMLQNSNAGISMGDVIMHGYNLKSGDAWYYQLATQVNTGSSDWDIVFNGIAGLLKIAYTNGDGNYNYIVVKGSASECDCSVETFPYASFIVTQDPVQYTEQQFKTELHYLNSMHEINNMKFCAEIIADGAKITYNQEEKFYKVEFSVDMDADSALVKDWFALPKEDMAVGGQTLNKYNYYNAVLEVWDNGYAKSFRSESGRDAGWAASGEPVDEFEYFWNEDEIMQLLKEDVRVDESLHVVMDTPKDYIDFYSNPDVVAAKLGEFKIMMIIIGCVIGAIILAIVIAVIVVETLLKKGKLPKLAAKRQAKKQKRLEKKASKGKNNSPSIPDSNETATETENVEEIVPESNEAQETENEANSEEKN